MSPERAIPERPGYHGLGKEPWIDHSRNVAACIKARLTRELAEHSMLARGFARRYSLSQEEVAAAVVACAQLHDFGKLRAQWQRWVEAYQQAKEVGYAHARALAHTDYDSRAWADRELTRQITAQTGPRGPHAAPGAHIARILLPGMLHPQSAPSMQLILCALGAILGHHGGWLGGEDQGDLEAGPLWHGWQTELHQLLGATIDHSTVQAVEGELGAQERRRRLGKVLDRVASAEALPDTWPLLAYLTRTLRLSDQKATEEGSDGA